MTKANLARIIVASVISLIIANLLLAQQALYAESIPASAGAPMMAELLAPAGPITVRSEIQFSHIGEPAAESIWAAGLSTVPGTRPADLSVAWIRENNTWLGETWWICLASNRPFDPSDVLPKVGSDLFAGYRYVPLINAIPTQGHVYEVSLGYDPGTGATSVHIVDQTAGVTIVNQGLQLSPYAGALYASAGYKPSSVAAGSNVSLVQPTIESLQVFDYFRPAGVTWELVEVGKNGALTPINVISRAADVRLQLRIPWKTSAGAFRLIINDKDGREHVLPINEPTGNTLVPLPLANLSAGAHRMAVEYFANGSTVSLGERIVQVGLVTSKLDGVRIRRDGDTSVIVEGRVVVQSDGAIDSADLNLSVSFEALGLSVDSSKREGQIIAEQTVSQPILTREITTLGVTPISFEFKASLELPQAPWYPYRTWRVSLHPTVQSGAMSQAKTYSELLRVTATPDQQQSPATGMRVMTYNIHSGHRLDGKLDLQGIADVISYSGAQIVGLNEVDKYTNRSGHVDQAGDLAKKLGMYVAFGPNINFQGGQYGNAILSRYPIVSVKNTYLPATKGERRGVLQADIDYNGTLVHFLVTHLGLIPEEYTTQLELVAEIARELTGPVVLVGDLNMVAGSSSDPSRYVEPNLRDVWKTGNYLISSERRIDYIFISQDLVVFGPDNMFTIDSPASDHRPVVADLDFMK